MSMFQKILVHDRIICATAVRVHRRSREHARTLSHILSDISSLISSSMSKLSPKFVRNQLQLSPQRSRYLSTPLDDDNDLRTNARLVERRFKLSFRSIRIDFARTLLVDDSFELLKLFGVVSRNLQSFVGGVGDVLELFRISKDDFVRSSLEKRDEGLSPGVLSFEVEFEFTYEGYKFNYP